ncbi:Iodothyronine deiodinase [Trinorchestia longiramus]|nr:Iodothyronine deiodinase [Trinorchestia longiramus]
MAEGAITSKANHWHRLCSFVRWSLAEHRITTKVGSPAPNPLVVELEGSRKRRLLDLAKSGRPLVLNFGSCS